ncbi:hypothetical protein [Cupriavidus alkaliphilus]|nr:hypothetical protein [Cupriavidus alkaliphilus]MBB3012037.1 hypothetical protein [Cupriavidus alkaliphilus]
MSESTTPAQCRNDDWNLARDAGLMTATPGTHGKDAGPAVDNARAMETKE